MNLNDKISEHFTVGEFIKTSYIDRVDKESGKTIGELQIEFAEKNVKKVKDLCEKILEKVRAYMINEMGMKSLIINSGFRCPELNKIIGGSPTSQHSQAEAVDINCSSSRVIAKQLFLAIYNKQIPGLDLNDIGQCILESTGPNSAWVHLSLATERYKESRREAGRTPTPEFLVTLTGKAGSYLPVSEDILNKYV